MILLLKTPLQPWVICHEPCALGRSLLLLCITAPMLEKAEVGPLHWLQPQGKVVFIGHVRG